MSLQILLWRIRPMREMLKRRNLENVIAQQQWSAAELRLASPPFLSLRSAPCVARLRGKQWIAQQ
jgi:hypothetical protein